MAACIFCRIIKGEIPSMKLLETERTLAFLDISPLSRGHALVIPKIHGAKLTDIPDNHLSDILPVAKQIANAMGSEHYNILQNNGKLAHQVVEHAHFHVIPKPNDREGLGINWPAQDPSKSDLEQLADQLKAKLNKNL